jgi:arylsulfatase A-like enzyme
VIAVATLRVVPLVGILVFWFAAEGRSAGLEAPPRGLVLVTVDTLRADHVSPYGGIVPTPSFEILAREGALAEQAYTSTPTTGPAHVSLLTGLYPWRHRTLENAVSVDGSLATLAEILRDEGFRTAAFVSSYVLHPRFGFDRGFERYEFEPTQSYAWRGEMTPSFWTRGEHTTRSALRWLNERAASGEERFFLWVHYFDPHAPYQPPQGFEVSPTQPVDLSRKLLPPEVSDAQELRRLIRAYRGEVRYADAQLGHLVERLRILALLESTVLVVTSDHGEGLGDHGLLEHGANLHEELVRVPLVVRAPGVAAGRRLRGPVQLEDLLPTALALLGVSVPEGLDGENLAPWLRGQTEASPREEVRGRRRTYATRPDLYYERRKGLKWIGELGSLGTVYVLERDPAEKAGNPGQGASETLRAEVAAARELPAAPPRPVDPEARRALEALGYLE